jgi:hypothetical protein
VFQFGLDMAMQYPNVTKAAAVGGIAFLFAMYAPQDATNMMKTRLSALITGRNDEQDDDLFNAPDM